LAGSVRREGREVVGCGGISRGGAGSAGSEVGKKKGRGEDEADRRGPGIGVRGEKKKRGRLGGPLRDGLVGRQAWLGRKVRRVCFLFFLFFFKLLFKQLFFSNSNQILSNFFSKIL
jgi:hypothetical protein